LAANALFSAERRARILELINTRKKLTVNELCQLLEVSAATVRGDLRDLDREGLLLRTHGGAIERSRASFEQTFSKRRTVNLSAKQAIAAAAEQLIESGDTILLDTGTTTIELARRLRSFQKLTVVTNDLEIARMLEDCPGLDVVIIGGTIRKGYHCAIGPAGLTMIHDLRVDKAFMATNSLSPDAGAMTPDLQQAATKKAMISIARKVLLLCDSSKIGRESFARFATLDQIGVLVSEHLSTKQCSVFAEHGIEIILADNGGPRDDRARK
jgi:DeoR family fructose operon transcriptional repressor